MSNKVNDRARVYVRFCCHFSLAGAWYPTRFSNVLLFQSKRPTVWPLRGMGAEGMGDIREKISCRLISREEKNLSRKCLAKKNSYTEEKRNLLWRLLEKKSYTHVCQEKSITRGLAKNLPSPTLLLPKANGRPLSIKLQLGRFIPGNSKCNGYRWTRWTKSDRDDTDEKGERGSRGNNRGVKPHHCFVTNELILRKFLPKIFQCINNTKCLGVECETDPYWQACF